MINCEIVKLGEVFSLIRNGASIKQGDVEGGYPITRIETISNSEFDRNKMGYAGITDLSKYFDYVLQSGDILMSHINSDKHLGKTALYEKIQDEVILHGMNLLCLRPIKNLIDYKYANYFFLSKFFKYQIPSITKKSVNQASFTVTALKELSFPLRPLETQQQIAKTLDTAAELLAMRKLQLAELDNLTKSIFYDMFGDPVKNEKGWETKQLKDLCENCDSQRIPITSSKRKKGIYPYYGASGIVDYVDDYIFDGTYLLVSEDGANLLARVTPIAFSIFGRNWVNNHAHVLRFQGYPLQLYVEHVINNIDISIYVTGSAQPKLNQANLNIIAIPYPPPILQNKFAKVVNKIKEQKANIQKAIDETQYLFDSLMSEYFD